ncbi:MAG: DUF1236 domain-containing protein [Pseudorhodoplanes sp.]|nr:DUF1236 domain-containing protein [Pseudorhodoplanes sp.]
MRVRNLLGSLILAVALAGILPVSAQVIDPGDPGSRDVTAPATTDLPKVVLDDQQRNVVRSNVKRVAGTTGAGDASAANVGEQIPPSVNLQRFPEIVYDEAPTLRALLYYATERDIVIVDPMERRVVAVLN